MFNARVRARASVPQAFPIRAREFEKRALVNRDRRRYLFGARAALFRDITSGPTYGSSQRKKVDMNSPVKGETFITLLE